MGQRPLLTAHELRELLKAVAGQRSALELLSGLDAHEVDRASWAEWTLIMRSLETAIAEAITGAR